MRRPEFLARQGRCPSGLLGSFIGRVMARETARENALAVELLQLKPTDHVLEAGFAHGRTIDVMARRVPEGRVAGVDISKEMLRLATIFNRDAIARGRVELKQGSSESLPYADQQFDKALAVHTIYFWQDPAAHFREFRRVLRNNGLLVVGFRPGDQAVVADFPASIYSFRSVGEIRQILLEEGFAKIHVTETSVTARQIAFVTASVELATLSALSK